MQRRTVANEEGWLLSYADLITNLLVFFAMLLGAAEISRSRMQQIAAELSGVEAPASLASIQEEIEARIEQEGLEEMIFTDLTDEGLKLSLNSGLVFDSGSALIRTEQESVLDSMLRTLVPYGQYDFAVEGHTDSQPISPGSSYKSNWELSADRANAVRGRLELVGIGGERIRVEGYADTITLPDETLEGLSETERLARHRRVVVRIY
ncbi:MAG: flagellar motor protein MotB [Myxococcales bacterium]|nr:flagellar motor protein MotB [Myxococcales bacterium]